MQLPAALQVNPSTRLPADVLPHTTRAALHRGARRVYRYILFLFLPAILSVLFASPLVVIGLISVPLVILVRWLAYDTPLPITRMNPILLVFAAAVLWNMLRAPFPQAAALVVSRILIGMTLFFLIADYADSPGRLWNVAAGLVIFGGLTALAAPFLTSPAAEKLIDVTRLFRPGIFGLGVSDPNMMAGALAAVIPLAVALLLSGEKQLLKIGAIALAPMLVMLLLLQARGAWLAAVGGVLIYLSLFRRLFIALIPLTLFLFILLNAYSEDIVAALELPVNLSGSLISLEGRWQVWEFATREIVREPLGHGIHSYIPYAENLASDYLAVPQRKHAHNLFFQAGFEVGLVGLGAFAALCAYGLYAGWHAVSRDVKRNLAIGIFAALCAGLLSAQLEANFWGNRAALIWWALLGMAVVLGRYGARRRRTVRGTSLQETPNPSQSFGRGE